MGRVQRYWNNQVTFGRSILSCPGNVIIPPFYYNTMPIELICSQLFTYVRASQISLSGVFAQNRLKASFQQPLCSFN